MHIARRMERMGTEAAFGIRARALELEAAGRDVIHLEMGEPDRKTPPHVAEAALRAIRDGHHGYTRAAGWPPLREAVAAHVSRTRGVSVDPEQVLICPGAKPVIFFTFLALVESGDEVVVPDPGFPIFESLIDSFGAVRRPYDPGLPGESRVDLSAIEAAITDRTRLVILNSPGNPTGAVLRSEEVRRIAELCRERDLSVLSDEIYSRIVFDGTHHSIAAEEGLGEKTILLDGFSKTYAMTGWRLGYAVVPRALTAAFERLLVNSVSCAVNFVQRAALAALQGPQDDVTRMQVEFKARRDVLVEALQGIPGVSCRPPEGAFFVFVDVRGTSVRADDLAHRLLEEAGVACVPGSAFGRGGEGFLRLSLTADAARIREAAQRLRDLLQA